MFLLVEMKTNIPLMVGESPKACRIYAVKRELAKATANHNEFLRKRLNKANLEKAFFQNCSNLYYIDTIEYYSEFCAEAISYLYFSEFFTKNP